MAIAVSRHYNHSLVLITADNIVTFNNQHILATKTNDCSFVFYLTNIWT